MFYKYFVSFFILLYCLSPTKFNFMKSFCPFGCLLQPQIRPKLVIDLLHQQNILLYNGCMSTHCMTFCLVSQWSSLWSWLVIAMWYLHLTIQSLSADRCVCPHEDLFVWGLTHTLLQVLIFIELTLCGPSQIDYFYDIFPLFCWPALTWALGY
jgi:hypothetical protein